MRISTTLLIAATVCTNYFAVHAYPSASGSCAAGVGSVQGSHLSSRAITGTLAKGGFSVSLGGVNLVADGTTTFPINTNTPLTLTGTKSFKGFLMRLGSQGGVTTTTALSAGSSMQVLNLCTDAGVGGVTHTSSSSKSTVTATLNMGAASSGMPLDVVVVVSNSGTSEYYHSQFFLTSAAAAVVPVTPAPVQAVTSTPLPVGVVSITTPAPVPVILVTSAPVPLVVTAPVVPLVNQGPPTVVDDAGAPFPYEDSSVSEDEEEGDYEEIEEDEYQEEEGDYEEIEEDEYQEEESDYVLGDESGASKTKKNRGGHHGGRKLLRSGAAKK